MHIFAYYMHRLIFSISSNGYNRFFKARNTFYLHRKKKSRKKGFSVQSLVFGLFNGICYDAQVRSRFSTTMKRRFIL